MRHVVAEPDVRVEGPPPGIASGMVDVPRWTIAIVGGAIVALGIAYLVVRVLRWKKTRRLE